MRKPYIYNNVNIGVSVITFGEPLLTREIEVTIFPDGRMDTRNAPNYVGLSEKTLAMIRCAGSGPKFVKLELIFYFREDIDEWINAGRVVNAKNRREKGALVPIPCDILNCRNFLRLSPKASKLLLDLCAQLRLKTGERKTMETSRLR